MDDLSGRIAARLEVVEALLWGHDHAYEVLSLVASLESARDGVAALTSPPFALSEFAAHHVLDMQFRRLDRQSRKALEDERERLLRGEDPAQPPTLP